MRKRDFRRAQADRVKAKRQKYYTLQSKPYLFENPCVCSCELCGNRRKHEGETIQERKGLNAR